VRITDGFPDATQVVMADAIKFAYVTAPVITAHPQGRTIKAGSNVTFTVTATGTPPPAYQWRFNGANIAGATSSSFSRINAQTNHTGVYSVVVSNVAGFVSSSNAVLTVVPPMPPRIESITLLPDNRVRLLINGEPGQDYQVQRSSNLSDWGETVVVPNPNGAFEYTDGPVTNQTRRFYRILMVDD
jgi:hypothetical protein